MKTVSLIIGLPLILSYFFSIPIKQKIATVLPLIYFSSVIWLLIFGMYDKLQMGLKLLMPFYAVIALLLVIFFKKQVFQIDKIKEFFSPAILFFIITSVFMYRHSSPMRFYEWDEFSYWGTAVKALFLFDKLSPYAPAGIAFPEFIPGAPLFPYLVSEINGVWHEGHVYWSYQVLLVSMATFILSRFEWKKFKILLISIPLILLSFTFFYNSFQTVYADPLLGIIFGCLLILSTSEKLISNKSYLLNIVIFTIYLSLIKDIGIYFAGIAILLTALNLFLRSKNHKFKYSSFFILACLAPILWIKLKWASILQATGLVSERSITEVLKDVLSGAENPFTRPYWPELKSNFLNRIFDGKLTQINSASISIAEWLIIFTLIILIISKKPKSERVKESLFAATIIFGFVGYLLILLFLYALVFSQNEAVGLASFERYVSTYLIAIVIWITYKVIKNLNEFEVRQDISIATFMWIVLFMLQSSPANLLTYLSNPSFQSDNWRNAYADRSWLIAEVNLPPESKVWIIAQHTVGFEFYLFQYELLPASVGKIPWSIGSISGPGDIWTDASYDAKKWNQALNDYDYVFVNNVTESFIEEFGSLFEDPNTLDKPGIYEIKHEETLNKLIKIR